jgi:hypothetical protein
VRSRNYSSFDDIAETALKEESAIFSKNERCKNFNVSSDSPKCTNCNKVGHVASACYLKDKMRELASYRLGALRERRAAK